jgi:hypothetical protein
MKRRKSRVGSVAALFGVLFVLCGIVGALTISCGPISRPSIHTTIRR